MEFVEGCVSHQWEYLLAAKDAEIAYLRAALAPILAHADADDKAPPIRFSVEDCRRTKEAVG